MSPRGACQDSHDGCRGYLNYEIARKSRSMISEGARYLPQYGEAPMELDNMACERHDAMLGLAGLGYGKAIRPLG